MAPIPFGGPGRFDLGQKAWINVTPLIGVMLLLLVVFMLSAPSPPPSIRLDIPTLGDSIDDRPSGIFINIERDMALYIGARPTALENLVAEIGAIEDPAGLQAPIGVRANRAVPYKDVITVLRTLEEAGYTHVGLVMEDL